MKKLFKFMFTLIGIGTAAGAAFVWLKNRGFITVTTGTEDEDYDDFLADEAEDNERSYINVDTQAMKEKAKEVAQELKEEIKDKAEAAYDEAKKMAKDASKNIANTVEKVWYEAEDTAEMVEEKIEEKVEEFFNDEEEA